MGELTKLLSGMAEWDREAVIAKYNALFDGDPSEEEVAARLGSPTMTAVRELRGYAPTPNPAEDAETTQPEGEPPTPEAQGDEVPEAATPEADEAEEVPADGEAQPLPPEPETVTPEDFPDIEALLDAPEGEVDEDIPAPLSADQTTAARRDMLPADAAPEIAAERLPEYVELSQVDLAAEEPEYGIPPVECSKLRPGRVILYTLFGLLLCLPAAAVLAALALATLALGVGVCAAGIFAVTLSFHGITVFADVMLLCGVGVATAALGVPIAFFAFWFFTRCVIGFVDLVLRGGKKWCRETPEKEDEDE
jgi:uncharacterized membrane protein